MIALGLEHVLIGTAHAAEHSYIIHNPPIQIYMCTGGHGCIYHDDEFVGSIWGYTEKNNYYYAEFGHEVSTLYALYITKKIEDSEKGYWEKATDYLLNRKKGKGYGKTVLEALLNNTDTPALIIQEIKRESMKAFETIAKKLVCEGIITSYAKRKHSELQLIK